MPDITMYSAHGCGYCQSAERLLTRNGVDRIDKILVDEDPAQFETMQLQTGRRTVPQVFIGDVHVGGFDDLALLERSGRLTDLLR